MAYKKIKSYKLSEEEMRKMWQEEYCQQEIYTFDDILVKFYPEMFDHCFYESENRKARDKSILSLNRLEKMLWIKDTLRDAKAILKQGYDKKRNAYDNSRRVAVVKDNYIVIIVIYARKKRARFITAFEMNDDDNLEKLLDGPNWTK